MKKIINRTIYDTDKSKLIAEHSNGLSRYDFYYLHEKLYRTSRCLWFIFGEGGPNTRYRTKCGDMFSSGINIIPLTKNEALEWMELIDQPIVMEKYFGDALEEA